MNQTLHLFSFWPLDKTFLIKTHLRKFCTQAGETLRGEPEVCSAASRWTFSALKHVFPHVKRISEGSRNTAYKQALGNVQSPYLSPNYRKLARSLKPLSDRTTRGRQREDIMGGGRKDKQGPDVLLLFFYLQLRSGRDLPLLASDWTLLLASKRYPLLAVCQASSLCWENCIKILLIRSSSVNYSRHYLHLWPPPTPPSNPLGSNWKYLINKFIKSLPE